MELSFFLVGASLRHSEADIHIASVACTAIACSTANLASCSFGSFVGGICIRLDKDALASHAEYSI